MSTQRYVYVIKIPISKYIYDHQAEELNKLYICFWCDGMEAPPCFHFKNLKDFCRFQHKILRIYRVCTFLLWLHVYVVHDSMECGASYRNRIFLPLFVYDIHCLIQRNNKKHNKLNKIIRRTIEMKQINFIVLCIFVFHKHFYMVNLTKAIGVSANFFFHLFYTYYICSTHKVHNNAYCNIKKTITAKYICRHMHCVHVFVVNYKSNETCVFIKYAMRNCLAHFELNSDDISN